MLDPISQSISWNIIDGLGLVIGPLRATFAKSGLEIDFQPGRVGAIGLDFFTDQRQEKYEYIPWSFVLKIINTGPKNIALRSIRAQWLGSRGFGADSNKYGITIRPIHPAAVLPDDGDETLPRLIPAGATEILEVDCTLWLYKSRLRFWRRQKVYTAKEYGHEHPKLHYVVTLKTNRGLTKLKSR